MSQLDPKPPRLGAHLGTDVRHAFVRMARRPSFTAIALLSLALGIGANTAIFSLLNAVFFRPLVVEDPASLVTIRTHDETTEHPLVAVSRDNYVDVARRVDSLADLEAWVGVMASFEASAETGANAEPALLHATTDGFASMLGLQAARGRLLDERDRDTLHAVVSYETWLGKLDADPDVVGRTVRLNGVDFDIVGVGQVGFSSTEVFVPATAWVPVTALPVLDRTMASMLSRRGLTHHVVARLADGRTVEDAEAELAELSSELARRFPAANGGRVLRARTLAASRVEPALEPVARKAGAMLTAVVGLVLLLACANVASLLITQTWERRRELAIRRAMGASARRIVAQLVTEGLVLALLGGAIAVFVAAWATDLIWVSQPGEMWHAPPFELAFDVRVLVFALVVSLFSGVLFTVLPAVRALRTDPMQALREQVRIVSVGRRPRLRVALIVAQVAIAVVSVSGAALFLQSLHSARLTDPGFEVGGTHVVQVTVPAAADSSTREQVYEGLLAATNSTPGVEASALAEDAPMRSSLMRTVLEERDDGSHSTSGPIISVTGVTPEYFATLEIDTLTRPGEGPLFARGRVDGALQAILSQEAALLLFPGEEPVGQRFRFIGFPMSHEVVGVVADTKVHTLGERTKPIIYVWLAEQRHPRTAVIVRGNDVDPRALEKAIATQNPSIAVHPSEPLSAVVAASLWGAQLGAGLLVAFGAVALVLAAIGIFGFAGFLADRRTKEIGIRMALGADPRRMIEMLMRESVAPVLVGVVVGLAVAFGAAQSVRDLVFDVPLQNPTLYLAGAGVIVVTALIAAWIPIARAVRLDPMEALRR